MNYVAVWTPDMAKLGDLTAAATASKTKKKEPTCEYRETPVGSEWRLDKLHEYVNNGDPRSSEQLSRVRRCLGKYSYCPAEVVDENRPFSGCRPVGLSTIGGNFPCMRDIQQLERVRQAASSFYDSSSGHKLFTRAIYKENIEFLGKVKIDASGRWIPEAEIVIRFENPVEEVGKMFVQELKDQLKQCFLSSKGEVFSLGNYRRFRRGADERRLKRWDGQEKRFYKIKKDNPSDNPYQHFHYEEFLTYPTRNPYVCNHSIHYPVNP